jgi:hypothetical protein
MRVFGLLNQGDNVTKDENRKAFLKAHVDDATGTNGQVNMSKLCAGAYGNEKGKAKDSLRQCVRRTFAARNVTEMSGELFVSRVEFDLGLDELASTMRQWNPHVAVKKTPPPPPLMPVSRGEFEQLKKEFELHKNRVQAIEEALTRPG